MLMLAIMAALTSCQKEDIRPGVARIIYRIDAPEGGTASALINGTTITEQIGTDGYAQFSGNVTAGDAISVKVESAGPITVEIIANRQQYRLEHSTQLLTINTIWQ